MALSISHTSSSVRHTTTHRTSIVLTVYVVLIWLALALAGSLLGTFIPQPGNPPLAIMLAVGGPIVVFVAAYLLSNAFREFTRFLIGDAFSVTMLQVSRIVGGVFVVEVFRHALPAVFGLPAGLGDVFIGVTAPLVALAWSSGNRTGKIAFVLWSALGMLDLVIAVSLGVGAASIPPTTASLRVFPLSLIPTFAVPLSFILHLAGLGQFWYLSRKGDQSNNHATS